MSNCQVQVSRPWKRATFRVPEKDLEADPGFKKFWAWWLGLGWCSAYNKVFCFLAQGQAGSIEQSVWGVWGGRVGGVVGGMVGCWGGGWGGWDEVTGGMVGMGSGVRGGGWGEGGWDGWHVGWGCRDGVMGGMAWMANALAGTAADLGQKSD